MDESTGNRIEVKLDRILHHLQSLNEKVDKMASALDTSIAQLQSDVAAQTTIVQSAITLINGIAAQVAAAVAAALAAGATPEELQAMTDLDTGLKAQASSLAAAVQANTPPAPQAKK